MFIVIIKSYASYTRQVYLLQLRIAQDLVIAVQVGHWVLRPSDAYMRQ